jgi:Cu/Ag efflux pump CusA
MMLFLGGSAILTAPKDIFPNINIPVVTVIWQYTGLTPEEMEQRVTTYSEYSISSNVSDTLSGVAVEKIFFQPNVNVDLAISQIVSASNAIRSLMPVGIQPPRHCPIQCFVGSGAPTELELRPAERAAALRLRHLPDTPGTGADRWHYAADPLWRQIPADHG